VFWYLQRLRVRRQRERPTGPAGATHDERVGVPFAQFLVECRHQRLRPASRSDHHVVARLYVRGVVDNHFGVVANALVHLSRYTRLGIKPDGVSRRSRYPGVDPHRSQIEAFTQVGDRLPSRLAGVGLLVCAGRPAGDRLVDHADPLRERVEVVPTL